MWETDFKRWGAPVVGWLCGYTPVELMDAAGLVPARIAGEHAQSSLADSLTHTNICPYIKSCVDAAATGKFDFLSAVVFTNGCDAQRRLYDVWKNVAPHIPAFLLVVPRIQNERGAGAFAARLAELKSWLETTFGKTISDEAIRESIGRYVELRENLKEYDRMRLAGESAPQGSRAMETHLAAQRMPAVAASRMVKDEITALKSNPGDIAAERGPRVLLAGNMTDDPDWVRQVEAYGARVVADDLCTGRRFRSVSPPREDIPPLEALSKSYLLNNPCPRMAGDNSYVDSLIKTISETNPDGVIFHTLKFCDTHLYDAPFVRDALREMGVKTLFIEGDYTSGSGQLATRIQAFVEML